jgi:hypothetical protein
MKQGINFLNARCRCNTAAQQYKYKNTLLLLMAQSCVHRTLKFRFVLIDSWFLSKEKFDLIARKA